MPTKVQYVGKRQSYTDSLYGTGDWTKGEIKPVHDVTAVRMLKHTDQYQAPKSEAKSSKTAKKDAAAETENATVSTSEATAEAVIAIDADVVGEPKPAESEDEKASQDARDSVAHMDKDALLNYAQVHFRQSLDKRMAVEGIRQKVVGLIDQFGLQ